MESRAQLLGHSVHQMLVTLPIGAFGFAVACDTAYAISKHWRYAAAARFALDFGLATSLLAIPFGYVDFLAIERRTRAKRIGLLHAFGNLAMLGMFATSRILRGTNCAPRSARWLSGGGFLLSGVGAWLGGELITRHGIGVHDVVGQDAPSSLSKAPLTSVAYQSEP